MPRFLSTAAIGFDAEFDALISAKREDAPDVEAVVRDIIETVRRDGDRAVIAYSEQFDRVRLTPETLAFSAEEIKAATNATSPEDRAALELAADRIAAFHARQLPEGALWTDEVGMTLGWRWTPVDAAGLYAPGGTASYPSSVLMNAIPARAAGVERIALCVPAPDGALNPLVLAAAALAGVSEVYRIGGAQAIAALAYGTETIAPVDVVTGPGNAYVAAAKRLVFGRVGIDSIAGPSEVLIIADRDNDPRWLALDLLAQAEHDVSAQSILMTPDGAFAEQVRAAVTEALETLPRRDIAAASWKRHGAIVVVRDLDEAAALANRLAPEHLQLCVADAEALAEKTRHAGAIFLGAQTPEAIGDYVGGPNHVLPTARSARYASGLSTIDFMKRTTLARASPGALARVGPAAERLAQAESLEAHGRSVAVRRAMLNEGEEERPNG